MSQTIHPSKPSSYADSNSQHIDDSDVEFPSDESVISGFDDVEEDDFDFQDALEDSGESRG